MGDAWSNACNVKVVRIGIKHTERCPNLRMVGEDTALALKHHGVGATFTRSTFLSTWRDVAVGSEEMGGARRHHQKELA